MTTNHITAHGLKFIVECSAFNAGPGAEADFDLIASKMEDALTALPVTEVARIHTGAFCDDEGPADEAVNDELHAMLRAVAAPVLASSDLYAFGLD